MYGGDGAPPSKESDTPEDAPIGLVGGMRAVASAPEGRLVRNMENGKIRDRGLGSVPKSSHSGKSLESGTQDRVPS